MTKAEIERYIEEALSALSTKLSVASIEYDGVEAWNISMKCPQCGDFSFSVRQCGDTSIQEQIKSNLQSHAAAH